MFQDHHLENRTNSCVVADKCVDYVTVTFPNSTDEEKTCGTEPPLGTIFLDGHSEIDVEFYANRHEQATGFAMNVLCYEPGTAPARRRRRRRRIQPVKEIAPRECVEVSTTERPTVDSAQQLVSIC